MAKTIKPSDLRSEAQKLIEAGKMPPLAQLLGAVAHVRTKYADRITHAQAAGPDPENEGQAEAEDALRD